MAKTAFSVSQKEIEDLVNQASGDPLLALLTGLTDSDTSVITELDNVLTAFGKLKARLALLNAYVSDLDDYIVALDNSLVNKADATAVQDALDSLNLALGNKAESSVLSNYVLQTALTTALNLKADLTALNTKADLVGGLVPASQLPSYVDDVLEFADFASLPTLGESGKIYMTINNNKNYRWSGSVYVEVSPSEVNSVNGQTGVVNLTKADLGLSNVDNVSDANKPVSSATQTALNLKENKAEVIQDLSASGATLNVDLSLGKRIKISLSGTGNLTLSFTNPIVNNSYVFDFVQGTTARNIIFPTGTVQANGQTTTIAGKASSTQTVYAMHDGTNFRLDNSSSVINDIGNQTIAGNKTFTGTTVMAILNIAGLLNSTNNVSARQYLSVVQNITISSVSPPAINLDLGNMPILNITASAPVYITFSNFRVSSFLIIVTGNAQNLLFQVGTFANNGYNEYPISASYYVYTRTSTNRQVISVVFDGTNLMIN